MQNVFCLPSHLEIGWEQLSWLAQKEHLFQNIFFKTCLFLWYLYVSGYFRHKYTLFQKCVAERPWFNIKNNINHLALLINNYYIEHDELSVMWDGHRLNWPPMSNDLFSSYLINNHASCDPRDNIWPARTPARDTQRAHCDTNP